MALTDSNQPLPSGKPSGRWCETWHWQTQTYLYLQADLQAGSVRHGIARLKPTFTFRQTFRQVVWDMALPDSNLPLPPGRWCETWHWQTQNLPLPSGRPSGRWCETWHWQTQNLPLPSGRPSGRWCQAWHWQTQTYLYLQADLQAGGVRCGTARLKPTFTFRQTFRQVVFSKKTHC